MKNIKAPLGKGKYRDKERDALLNHFRSRLTGKRGEQAQIAKVMGVAAHHVGEYANGTRTPWMRIAKRLIAAQDEYLSKARVVRNPLGSVQTVATTEAERKALAVFNRDLRGCRFYFYYTTNGILCNREHPRRNGRTIPVTEYIELLTQHYRP